MTKNTRKKYQMDKLANFDQKWLTGQNGKFFMQNSNCRNFENLKFRNEILKNMRDWWKSNLNRRYFETFELTWNSQKGKVAVSPWFMAVNHGSPHEKLTIVDLESIGCTELELFFDVWENVKTSEAIILLSSKKTWSLRKIFSLRLLLSRRVRVSLWGRCTWIKRSF